MSGKADPPPWRIALLRAVNLGPHNRISTAQLRELMADAGLAEGRTFLQSGNLVFRDPATPADLEARLEAGLSGKFGLATDVMVRTAETWRALEAANPFVDRARSSPAQVVLHVLKHPARSGGVEALRAAIRGPERIEAGEGALYMDYPEGIGTSRLTTAVITRALGVAGTARNWNTVLALADMTLPP